MPRLSVVIPHISSDAALEQTLLSVLENRDRNCEVIVAHCDNYTDPYALDGDEVSLLSVADARHTDMINEAIDLATGSVIQVILPGTVVSSRWYADALPEFDDYRVGAVATAIHCEDLGTDVVGLRSKQLPRHQVVAARELGEEVHPIINGGYFRKKLLSCMDGLLSCDCLAAAETELAAALQALEIEVRRCNDVTLTCDSWCTNDSGYVEGQQLAKVARAYASLAESPITIDSMPVRMGKLAASILNPHLVSHRLGWTLGLQDSSLVTPIRNRFERTQDLWSEYLDQAELRTQSSYRRAA